MVVDEANPQGWSVRRLLPISLTYDHRIVNGVPAGRFLDDLAELHSAPDKRIRISTCGIQRVVRPA